MSVFDKDRKILFVHIPKNAGGSIIRELKSLPDASLQEVPNNRATYDNYHSTYMDCKEYIDDIDAYYKFATVRNPWDRATSWYFYRKSILIKEHAIAARGKSTIRVENDVSSIRQELRYMNQGFSKWLLKYHDKCWDFTWFSLSKNQMTWLNGGTFDKIIRFENLQKEISHIPGLTGINFNIHETKNSKLDYRKLYNKKSISLIESLYKEDILEFNYKFGELK